MSPPAEKLVFATSIEALFQKGLGGNVPPALKAEVKKLGVDLDKPLPPAVTREAWFEMVECTAKALHPMEPRERAMWLVGKLLFKGLEESLIGKALAPFVRALGPARLLKRFPQNMKSANNFATATYEDVGPSEGVLWMNDATNLASLTAGTIDSMVRWAGATDVKVVIEPLTPPEAKFRVTWVR